MLAVEYEPVETVETDCTRKILFMMPLIAQEKMEFTTLAEEFVFLEGRDTESIVTGGKPTTMSEV